MSCSKASGAANIRPSRLRNGWKIWLLRRNREASGASASMLLFNPVWVDFSPQNSAPASCMGFTGDRAALEEAIRFYRAASAAWTGLAESAKGTYVPDITVGEYPWLRGHWLDRLTAIDADIALLEKRLPSAMPTNDPRVKAAIAEAAGRPRRPSAAMRHRAQDRFRRRQPLELELTGPVLASVRLHYRHVNQAERWQSALMDRKGLAYVGAIPSAYTDSPYPLQYYFELNSAPDRAWLHPGFPADLAGQPYYVIRSG
jgi:hypothetical protein